MKNSIALCELFVNDSLALVQRGDLKGTKARIKDLETAWDAAEQKMRPMGPKDWTVVDKSIDRALATVRSGQPDHPSSYE